jgi:pimeloyl-ACP methyl ester carboxylesterase
MHSQLFPIKYWLVICGLLIFSACNNDDVKPVANKVLVSADSQQSKSASELRLILGLSGLQLPFDKLQYDAEIYKVTYNTTYLNDQPIVASGLVVLPKTPGNYPMVSFQHGTIASQAEAPSALSGTDAFLFAALASPGLIVAIPDFIGFGRSSSVPHPYFDRDLTASAVIDLLKAAKELATDRKIDFNGKLFLAGYSQGGHATMATHRALEKEPIEGFELIASFPAAGGYDVKNMQEYFFSLDTYENPFYIAYVAFSYKTSYSWSAPLNDFFKEPYASRIPTLFNGSKTGSEINAQLTNKISDLITDDLRTTINTNPKYKYIVDAFNLNSLTDWTPTRKVFMYHGDADLTVPFSNSTVTYNKLIANGASSSIISLKALPGKDHSTGVVPYFESFIPTMLDLR